MIKRTLRTAAPALALAALVAVLAGIWLASTYGSVENRFSFGWDAARRSELNLRAADALRRGDLPDLLWLLGGPETWPTLRMVFAAPLLAITGPSFVAESGLTIIHYVLIFMVLAFAAVEVAPSRVAALLAFAVAAAAFASNRALLGYATTAMLEPLSALTALAAILAWMAFRRSSRTRIWPLALAANLVFHTKWQYGFFLAAAILALEAGSLPRDELGHALRGLAAAARGSVRHATAWIALALSCCSALAALAVLWTGGFDTTVGGLRIMAKSANGPVFWAVFMLFYGTLVELWRARAILAEAVPRHIRGLFLWIVVPMAAWILVPFTWRLRTIFVTAALSDSNAQLPDGPLAGLVFLPARDLG